MSQKKSTSTPIRPADETELIKLDKSEPYSRSFAAPNEGAMPKNDLSLSRQKLNRALDRAWLKYHGGFDGGRRGVRMALAAVCEFLQAAAPNCGEQFDVFNMVLIAALSDLDRGIVAPLFGRTLHDRESGDREIGDRESGSYARRDVQNRAAATMATLMYIGFGRELAAKKVAETLVRNGLRKATPRAVKKWFDERLPPEIKRKRRPRGFNLGTNNQSAAYLHYVALSNERANSMMLKGCKQQEICKQLEHELSYFVRLWNPSPVL